MKKKFVFVLLMAIIQICVLVGCKKTADVLSEKNGETEIGMEVTNYTDSVSRTLTINNTQSGTFFVQYSPTEGEIRITITDGTGKIILDQNEKATLREDMSKVGVKEGNGTYQIDVHMKKFTGSFDISWKVEEIKEASEPTATTAPVEKETTTPTIAPEEKEPTTPTPTIAPEKEGDKKLTEFQSDFGYSISYEEEKVDYRRTVGYDEFILKSDDLDAPFVFVTVSRIEAERVELVKTSALTGEIKDCTLGQEKMAAQCCETKEIYKDTTTVHQTYLCPLESGDALLVEAQWHTIGSDRFNEAWAQGLLDSIQCEDTPSKTVDTSEKPGGISDDVIKYGVLSSYDTKKRMLCYTPIEIVLDTDTKRIQELKELGIEPDFPNGHYIHQPNGITLEFPVSESVKVSLLNDACELESSTIEVLADLLEGHPEFFLCELHCYEGEIIEIKEKFLP